MSAEVVEVAGKSVLPDFNVTGRRIQVSFSFSNPKLLPKRLQVFDEVEGEDDPHAAGQAGEKETTEPAPVPGIKWVDNAHLVCVSTLHTQLKLFGWTITRAIIRRKMIRVEGHRNPIVRRLMVLIDYEHQSAFDGKYEHVLSEESMRGILELYKITWAHAHMIDNPGKHVAILLVSRAQESVKARYSLMFKYGGNTSAKGREDRKLFLADNALRPQ